MPLVKRPLCYPRKPFTGGTPAPTTPAPPSTRKSLGSIISRTENTVGITYNGWAPIGDLDGYVEFRRKHATTLIEHANIQKIIAKHEEYYRKHPPANKPPKVLQPVLSNVLDEGHPLTGILSRSIADSEIIDIYKKAGYSTCFLDDMTKKLDGQEAARRRADEHLDKVLDRYPGKSTTKKKKISLRTKYAALIKIRNKNHVKADEIEYEESGDNKDVDKDTDKDEGEEKGGNDDM